ncbi:unnamed protein product [Cylicocyclus nassatus]|uniref:Uncharacterized protein n=1 Tax=Cylicocyclus nassatus TaxID=53992 RepID=A0AA36DPD7_CYLNA|nr:unnamed protein product [Cylicocyclus nassatus]
MLRPCITLVLVKLCLPYDTPAVDHCGLSDEWEEALFSAAVFDFFGPANPGVALDMGYSWSYEQKAYAIGKRRDSPDRKQRGLWYGYNNKRTPPNEIAADAFQAWRKELKGFSRPPIEIGCCKFDYINRIAGYLVCVVSAQPVRTLKNRTATKRGSTTVRPRR